MTEGEFNWPYWSVYFPGIGRAQAEDLLSAADKAGMSFGGMTVDPSDFLTLQLGRSTVAALYRVLSPAEKDSVSTQDDQNASGFREILKEWLDGLPSILPGSGEAGLATKTEDQFDRSSWFVDLPGIGRSQAEELLALAVKAGLTPGGTVVDPREIFTAHLDRYTVEGLYCALISAEKDEASVRTEGHDAHALREALKEWLDQNGS
jgi:hypothetical protein